MRRGNATSEKVPARGSAPDATGWAPLESSAHHLPTLIGLGVNPVGIQVLASSLLAALLVR